MKIIKLFYIFLFLNFSCSHEGSNVEFLRKQIAGEKYKIWDIVRKDQGSSFYNCFYFSSDGAAIKFDYDMSGKRVEHSDHDVIHDNQWQVNSRDIIILWGSVTKILKLNEDTLIIDDAGETLVMIKSKDQSNPIDQE